MYGCTVAVAHMRDLVLDFFPHTGLRKGENYWRKFPLRGEIN